MVTKIPLPDPATLVSLPLFRGLTTEQLSALNELLHLKRCPAGTPLILSGQSGEICYIILEGTIKIHVEQRDGTTVILATLGAGDSVGEMSLVDDSNRCADVVTLEDTTLLWMSRADYYGCMRAIPEIACNVARILASRLRAANEQIMALATLEVESRVARQILALSS